jgi:putative peptide zinc metalloprotease protein
MADAPATFSESWYRIANQRLSLRPDVNARRQVFRGERWVVLDNAFNNQFFRLRPEAWEFVGRLRANRTVEEAWQECVRKFPDTAPGQETLVQLLGQLYQANLLLYDQAADTTNLFERFRKTRQRETRMRLLNVMFARFPLLDPDRLLNAATPYLRWLISPLGTVLWLLVVGWAGSLAVEHADQLRLQSEAALSPANLPLLYLGLVLIKTLHEFGHAAACKRFGGEVHVMGVMLMVFTPVPYMDATSAWGFRSRWHRLLVGAAGMIAEVFVAALATFVWVKTGPGAVHSLAYNMMLVASVSTVLFNLNPLLRYDGYYMLVDLLGLPNLSQNSNQHLIHLAERKLFGVKQSESPATNRSERIWFTSYGIAANIYRILVFSAMVLLVADQYLLLGVIMAVACLIAWLVVPLVKLINYLVTSPRLERCRPRAMAVCAGFAAVGVAFLTLVPLPYHFRAPGVLEANQWSQVVTEAPGQLTAVLATPGSPVKAGQPLFRLTSRELELERHLARTAVTEVETRIRQAMDKEPASLRPLQAKLESNRKRLARVDADLAALTVRARHDGIWISPQAAQMLGRHTPRGAAIGMVVNPAGFEFSATVLQEDVNRLFTRPFPGAEARLHGQAGRMLNIGQLRVVPAEQSALPSAALGWGGGGEVPVAADDPQGRRAAEPFFSVRGPVLGTPDLAQLHGRSGKLRLDLPPEPLLPRWITELRQLLQKRYQL